MDNVIDQRHRQSRVRIQYDRTHRDDPTKKAFRMMLCGQKNNATERYGVCVGGTRDPSWTTTHRRPWTVPDHPSACLTVLCGVLRCPLLRCLCYDPCFEDHELHPACAFLTRSTVSSTLSPLPHTEREGEAGEKGGGASERKNKGEPPKTSTIPYRRGTTVMVSLSFLLVAIVV